MISFGERYVVRTTRMSTKGYMYNMVTVFVVAVVLILFFGCNVPNFSAGTSPSTSDSAVYIVPQAGNGISLLQSQQFASRIHTRVPNPVLHATVPDHYVISHVINKNLDRDTSIEQVVLYRDAKDEDYIRIMIIDYDRRRNSYIRAWEGESTAQDATGAEIDFVDLTNDDVEELLVYGRSLLGAFTLDVFAVEFVSEEAIISLTHIDSFQSESTIGIKAGVLPQIVVEARAPSFDNDEVTDQIQLRVYQWSQNLQRFYRFASPPTPNSDVSSQQFFEQLLHAPIGDLIELIAGEWMTQDGAETFFLIIDDANDTLSLQIDQRQIVFYWKGAFKTIVNGFPTVHITLLNEYIPSLISQASITPLARDEIRLDIPDELAATRSYRRVVDGLVSREIPRFRDLSIELYGWYEGVLGEQQVAVYFYKNHYLIHNLASRSGEQRRGVFSIYNIYSPILELVELDSNRVVRTHYQYLIQYQQRRERKQIIHALELQPVHVHYRGYEPIDAPAFQLVQIANILR